MTTTATDQITTPVAPGVKVVTEQTGTGAFVTTIVNLKNGVLDGQQFSSGAAEDAVKNHAGAVQLARQAARQPARD